MDLRTTTPITDDFVIDEAGRARYPLHRTAATPARGFGGHVAALALTAAYRTVPEPMSVRYLHAEYIAAAPLDAAPGFVVRSIQDGRSVARRLVEVCHGDALVAHFTVAFHRPDPLGLDHQVPMPSAGDPERLSESIVRPRLLVRSFAAERGRTLTWIRPAVLPLSPNPRLSEAALVYISDIGILWPTLTAHGLDHLALRGRALGTVAHSIWFHRRVPVEDWFLFDHRSPSTSAGLGHSDGRIFARDGRLVATCSQTGLLRPDSPQAWQR